MQEAPDGHTLLMMSNTSIVDAAVRENTGVDLLKDFSAVGMVASSPYFIVAGPSQKVVTMKDLIELAKEKPGQISYASSGVGSIAHFAGEYLSMVSGAKFLHVPFKGSPEQTLAVLSGDIDFSFKAPALVAPMLEGGKAKILASATAERYSRFPEVPTVIESGYPGYVVDLYYGMLVVKGTPAPVVEKLNAALNRALDLPNVKTELEKQFVISGSGTPEKFWERITGDVKIVGEVAATAGMKQPQN
jgi:tripartite-type tricarboxylate transporter receptor subunit TctC